jgi:hypothetical protein
MQYLWLDGKGGRRFSHGRVGIDVGILPLNHGVRPMYRTTQDVVKYVREARSWSKRLIIMGWLVSGHIEEYVADLARQLRRCRDNGLPLPDVQHDAEGPWRGYKGEAALLEKLILADPLLSQVRHSATTIPYLHMRKQDKELLALDVIDEDFVQGYSGYGRGWDNANPLVRPGVFQEHAWNQRQYHGKPVVMGIAFNHQNYPGTALDYEKGVRKSILTAYTLGAEDVAFWSRKHYSERYEPTVEAFHIQRRNPHLVLDGVLGPRTRNAR